MNLETLIIYDNNGNIFNQVTGHFITPQGIQHMIIEVPQGKYVARINTSVIPHVPVFEDYPKSEIEQLKEQIKQAEADNLTTLEALAEVYEMLLDLQA